MEGINWVELLPTIIPSAVAITLAVVAFVLKMKADSMTRLSKEVSELLLAIYEGYKDGKLSNTELKKIIAEGQDVIEEAKNLLNSE